MAGASLLRPKVLYPILILTFQSLLLVFGWVFYKITSNQPVALPTHLAAAYKLVPQTFTFVVTLIASAVSIASAYLYSLAIRYMLVRSLSKPVSLFAITSGIKVAGKSPLLNFSRPWWTILSLVGVAALGAQTAGWATLLTPRLIQITAEVTGFALDVSNSDFLQMAQDAYDAGNFSVDSYINVSPLILASGSTAVGASLGLPSILNYNKLSFLNNTGGILPANLVEISGTTPDTTLPVHTFVQKLQDTPLEFTRNYTVRQQGFTAVVSCEQRDPDDLAHPPISFANGTTELDRFEVNEWVMNVTCPSGVITKSSMVFGYVDQNANPKIASGILYAGCPSDSNFESGTIVLYGLGNFDWIGLTVCTATPQITIVDVNYMAPTSLWSIKNATDWSTSFIDVSEPLQAVDTPLAGGVPIQMIWNLFETQQTAYSHGVGDALSSYYFSPYGNTTDPSFLNRIIESYLKGVFEFSGTLLRAAYTQTNISGPGLFPDNTNNIPSSMRIPVSGTYVSETVGWKQKDATIPATFIAPSIVLITSIAVVLFTFLRMRDTEIVADQDHFDAGNILHVMSAASAGGLPHNFPPFSATPEEVLQYSQAVAVRLGQVKETGKIGFVHSSTAATSSV
ncbi:hypothetical protein BDN72DRAFT_902666 [Pluteus cervinus]|uniref:Uncharacterized protein n=1 Tax=Pluteus cervinus TaxID=181527 RepID=A0ACD3ACF2_9AGAR|nr:hypothetical protein BDN72DRAFT_902666 [Pluteus cervinus]